jgi:hypothetical protein
MFSQLAASPSYNRFVYFLINLQVAELSPTHISFSSLETILVKIKVLHQKYESKLPGMSAKFHKRVRRSVCAVCIIYSDQK